MFRMYSGTAPSERRTVRPRVAVSCPRQFNSLRNHVWRSLGRSFLYMSDSKEKQIIFITRAREEPRGRAFA